MCLYTNILKYTTRIPTKFEKVLKNDLQAGPKRPSATWERNRFRNPSLLSPTRGRDRVWTREVRQSRWVDCRPPLGVGSCLYQHIRHSLSVAATVFISSWWELLPVPFWRLHELLIKQTRDHMCGRRSRSRLQILKVGKCIEKETK